MTGDGDLEKRWDEAREVWPTVNVPLSTYIAYVRERASRTPGRTPHTGDGSPLRWSDLYLACACAEGNSSALLSFERTYFGEIAPVLSRLGKRAPETAEAVQLVRERLFSGPRPKIREYSGRGDLKSWLRVVIVRVALNATARKRPETSLEDHALTFLADERDPELEYMKQLYARHFTEAFATAVKLLDDEDRDLLHRAFVEGLTVDAIGQLFGVHRATAARWVKRAHARLVTELKAAFRRRIDVSDAEYQSILRLIESRLGLSLGTYLNDR